MLNIHNNTPLLTSDILHRFAENAVSVTDVTITGRVY